MYQQQLVWGGTELQDEFCLEEYSIPSGAQLKLLVAMRGGPIHAQRGICNALLGDWDRGANLGVGMGTNH